MSKILVIDDDSAVRLTIARVLQYAGYDVCAAIDGIEGLATFRGERPDLVISDIIMPRQEGIETIRQMLREAPGTRVIAMSGGARIDNVDFRDEAKRVGAREVLEKPFDPEELIGCVSRCLA